MESRSLKAQCVEILERLIISGELPEGSSLPPERDLAQRLGISRPVVHEAIVELAAKGFVRVEPRRGVKVNDFWRHGTLAIFESVILHSGGAVPSGALADMLAFRSLIELEAVRLAALSGGNGLLPALEALVEEEETQGDSLGREAGIAARTELDIRFHLLLAEASGNRILPLVMNSAVPVYRDFIRAFYAGGPDLPAVRSFHRDLVEAIAARKVDAALSVAKRMLDHGSLAIGVEPAP